MLTPWKKSYDQPREHIEKQRHYFAKKGSSSQGYGFSSDHTWMWELVCEESWAQKNWCFWTVVLEKTLESPLDCKEIQLVHSKGDQSWVFTGRTDVEAETPILWPLDGKSWLIWKTWCWERLRVGRGWLNGITNSMDIVNSGGWWWTGRPGVLWFVGLQSWTRLSDWTELNWYLLCVRSINFC